MKYIRAMIIIALLGSVVGFYGCRKNAPAGIPGPQGEQGAAGPEGPAGAKGPKGVGGDGIANVKSSDWIYTLTGVYYSSGDTVGKINADVFTSDVIEQGSVVIYFKEPGSGVKKLDYYSNSLVITQRLDIGVAFIYSNVDFRRVGMSFRYIIIPGTKGLSEGRASALPDLSNYQAVCKYYGIKE